MTAVTRFAEAVLQAEKGRHSARIGLQETGLTRDHDEELHEMIVDCRGRR